MRHHNAQWKTPTRIPLGVDLWLDDWRLEYLNPLRERLCACLQKPHVYATPWTLEDLRWRYAQLIGPKAARVLIARCVHVIRCPHAGLLWLLILLTKLVKEVGWSGVLCAWSPWTGLAPPAIPQIIARK